MNNLIFSLKNLDLHTKILIVIAVVVITYSAFAIKAVHEINLQIRELQSPKKEIMQRSPNKTFLPLSDTLSEESDDILHYPTEGYNHDHRNMLSNSRQHIIKNTADSASGKKTP